MSTELGNKYALAALKRKRAELATEITALHRQIGKLQKASYQAGRRDPAVRSRAQARLNTASRRQARLSVQEGSSQPLDPGRAPKGSGTAALNGTGHGSPWRPIPPSPSCMLASWPA